MVLMALVLKVLTAIFLTLAGWTGAVQPERETGGTPASAPVVAVVPEAAAGEAETPVEITDAESLLEALETAGEDIEILTANIRYAKTFAIQGDTQAREGRLVFESKEGETGQAARRFGITFDKLYVGSRLEDGLEERYIFDGEWIAEIYPKEKQFIRRQVVPPGERWDPLRIGEGPFPIPIQQKKDDILGRYSAELLEGADGLDRRSLQVVGAKCYQLRLTPLVGSAEDDLREVRIWYEKETLLPRIARTLNRAEDEAFVLLWNLATNGAASVTESELSTEPPADLTGWNFSQEFFRE